MEGDAGASRLNPADTDDSSSRNPHEAEQTSTETTAEGLVETEAEDESEAEVDLDTETEAEDESEAEVDLDTETDAEDESEAEVDLDTETEAEDESEGGNPPIVGANPSRLGRGWLIGITAALLVLAGGVGTGGYFALRANQESQAIARHDVEAVQAAKDCVVATQAPDVNAMTAGAQKIIDCSTGGFRAKRCCTAACSSRPIRLPTFTPKCPICVLGQNATTTTVRSMCWWHSASKCPTVRRKTEKSATDCG